MPYDSLYKIPSEFHKKFCLVKKSSSTNKRKGRAKKRVLDDVGDLFNELYYIYKDK